MASLPVGLGSVLVGFCWTKVVAVANPLQVAQPIVKRIPVDVVNIILVGITWRRTQGKQEQACHLLACAHETWGGSQAILTDLLAKAQPAVVHHEASSVGEGVFCVLTDEAFIREEGWRQRPHGQELP